MLYSPQAWHAIQDARHEAQACLRDLNALLEVARLLAEARDERSAIGLRVTLVRDDQAWKVNGTFMTA
jgi:exoribonuclease R